MTKPTSLVIFSSLPHVGGHSTSTLKFCELLAPMFDRRTLLVKDMPGHGFSEATARQIEATGMRVVHLPAGLVAQSLRLVRETAALRRPDVFLSIGMRYFSPLLVLGLRPARSIYFHNTHELTPATVRILSVYGRVFSQLVFISPATWRSFHSRWVPPERTSWDAHLMEVGGIDLRRQPRRPGPVRLGFLGRINREKGVELLMDFAEQTKVPCEIHVAGSGSSADRVGKAAAEQRGLGRVIFYGAYDVTGRAAFLNRFFSGIDWLCVPSLDDREGIPTVILEALEWGVPVLATQTGGITSFLMDELGPAPREAMRIVAPETVADELAAIVSSEPPQPEVGDVCRKYFLKYFSDRVLSLRWKKILVPERCEAEGAEDAGEVA